LGFVVVMKNW